ncbi:MAG: rhodanese-like domain-containing protein [Anaerolineae bacterium]|nr:rhodanese-like domain-containing protein [Anaerolineae bacterium]
MKKPIKQMVEEAEAEIETLPVEEVLKLQGDPDVIIVDLRDVRELKREGFIPGSYHAPRGMLEFWVDPDSPYHKTIFASGKHFIFYCNLGWRSALAAKVVQDMGLERVSHIGGGFDAWQQAGGPVERKEEKGK